MSTEYTLVDGSMLFTAYEHSSLIDLCVEIDVGNEMKVVDLTPEQITKIAHQLLLIASSVSSEEDMQDWIYQHAHYHLNLTL